MELKDWIRSVRTALKLTQTDFGERFNVTKGNVSAWENGLHSPSYAQIAAMSEMSGLPMPDIGGAQRPQIAAVPQRQKGHDEEVTLNPLVSNALHNLPVLTAGGIMQEQKHKTSGPFTWVAEDNHMAGAGDETIRKGYLIHFDPDAEFDSDCVVLVRVQGGPPVLRRIVYEGGEDWSLSVESGALQPRRYDPEIDEIIGVMFSISTPLRALRKKPGAENPGAREDVTRPPNFWRNRTSRPSTDGHDDAATTPENRPATGGEQ